MVCAELSRIYRGSKQNRLPVNPSDLIGWACRECSHLDVCPSQPVQLDEALESRPIRPLAERGFKTGRQ